MKHATLDITPELFVEFLKGSKANPPFTRRFIVKENPLPDDVEIVSVGLSNDEFVDAAVFQLTLYSEQFADVPEGQEPPPVPRILYETIYDAAR